MSDIFAPAKSAARDDLSGGTQAFGRLVGASRAMRDAIRRLRAIAARDVTLLLEGESGTGKEVAAEAVHAGGPRRHRPFVVVDCGAIARSLLEAELFGHERGAYTGATHARAGAFVHADGGTVLLDEIGELDLELQPRLLRLIERREVKPLGGSTVRRVDVRIIAATNRDLAREAARGTFRADLYYRLAVTCVRMPALSTRAEDIPILCRHIVDELSTRGPVLPLDAIAVQRLAERTWPGNVRELRNAVERMVTLGADGADLPDDGPPPLAGQRPSFHEAKLRLLANFERQYLRDVMDEHAGNITAAAQAAGVDRVHFLRLLDKYHMRKKG
jgi:two-component system response regulator GlrR